MHSSGSISARRTTMTRPSRSRLSSPSAAPGGDLQADQVARRHPGQLLHPEGGDGGEDPPLVGDGLGHHHVEGRHAVGRDEQQVLVVQLVDVAHLARRHVDAGSQRLRCPLLSHASLEPLGPIGRPAAAARPSSVTARISTASRAALTAPSMATVATGIPRGICTVEYRASITSDGAARKRHADHRQGRPGRHRPGEMGGHARAQMITP